MAPCQSLQTRDSFIYVQRVHNKVKTTCNTEEQEGQNRLCQKKSEKSLLSFGARIFWSMKLRLISTRWKKEKCGEEKIWLMMQNRGAQNVDRLLDRKGSAGTSHAVQNVSKILVYHLFSVWYLVDIQWWIIDYYDRLFFLHLGPHTCMVNCVSFCKKDFQFISTKLYINNGIGWPSKKNEIVYIYGL